MIYQYYVTDNGDFSRSHMESPIKGDQTSGLNDGKSIIQGDHALFNLLANHTELQHRLLNANERANEATKKAKTITVFSHKYGMTLVKSPLSFTLTGINLTKINNLQHIVQK